MADIELVIKIPEELYDAFKVHSLFSSDIPAIERAIKNGTPLPKGHGKIIDADYAIKQLLSLPKNLLSTEDIWAIRECLS